MSETKRRKSKRGLRCFIPRDQENGGINVIYEDVFNNRIIKEMLISAEIRPLES